MNALRLRVFWLISLAVASKIVQNWLDFKRDVGFSMFFSGGSWWLRFFFWQISSREGSSFLEQYFL